MSNVLEAFSVDVYDSSSLFWICDAEIRLQAVLLSLVILDLRYVSSFQSVVLQT